LVYSDKQWDIGGNLTLAIEIIGEKVILRMVEDRDLKLLWDYMYGDTNPEWKNWDAPYFTLEPISYDKWKTSQMKKIQEDNSSRLIIEADGIVIGMVTYYWEHEPSRWLECGIVIYRPEYWNGGFGTEALKLWVNHVFESNNVARVGITTWSGNKRMMKAAEKVGMQLEGRMRKCRYYNGEYYDSIRMGVLREEWAELHPTFYKGRLEHV
jgi:RimJ/RimL family protein N-acetyltransferase